MQILLGYELVYECPQPTPMLLMLNIHYARAADLVVPDHLVTRPSIPIRAYRDGFGNWCNRIVAPAGRTRLSRERNRQRHGRAGYGRSGGTSTRCGGSARRGLVFLLGSRYCETDRLSEIAWTLFGKTRRLGPRPGHLRLRPSPHLLRLRARACYEDGLGSLLRSHRRMPRLRAPGGRVLPLHEHPGTILHRLSG